MSPYSHLRRPFGLLIFALLFFVVPGVHAQNISDLREHAERFHDEAESLYKLDEQDMQQIWEAYCGVFDPKIKEDKDFAADIARQLQDKEKGIIEQLLGGELPSLLEDAGKIQDSSDAGSNDKDEAKNIQDALHKEEQKLQKLYDGVPLKGANHPFVQYAMEYGVQQHKDMCDKFGEEPRVCDKGFPGMDGRPDLVVIDDGHLIVYEFKPDNNAARDRGAKQVAGYLPSVAAYYESFFEDGRNSAFKGEPDSDHGGVEMLRKLKDSPEAWTDDGKHLQPVPHVETYRMCDKRFD